MALTEAVVSVNTKEVLRCGIFIPETEIYDREGEFK